MATSIRTRRQSGREEAERSVHVLMLPGVHLLDLSGPVQAIYEANGYGANYRLGYVGAEAEVRSTQGLTLARLEPLPEVRATDTVLVPGTLSSDLGELEVPAAWLREAAERGARIGSVCSGAFALGRAGLLDGRRCTTHWKVLDELRRDFPAAEVLGNRLFVRDGNLITSAGVASGIDMALALIEEDHGPKLTAEVARELVVYLRRHGDDSQTSVYLEFRSHIQRSVHRVQDWILEHPDRNSTLGELAALVSLSPRHLARVFREATGITPKAFAHKVKLELARQLLENAELGVDVIARRCGFEDPRQLRRLWKQHTGTSLRVARASSLLSSPSPRDHSTPNRPHPESP